MAGADSGQHGLAEVVNAIVEQDGVAVLQDVAYHHQGGSIAGNARKELEKALGRSVISPKNSNDFKLIDE